MARRVVESIDRQTETLRPTYRRVGPLSKRFNIDYYPDEPMIPEEKVSTLRQVLDNIGAANKKTRARVLKVYKRAYRKHPGSTKLLHVIEYIERMNKGSRKLARRSKKVVI